MRRLATLAVALIALVASPARHAEAECRQELIDLLQRFDMLVIDYRNAPQSNAVEEWLTWKPKMTLTVVAAGGGACDPMKPWSSDRYQAAAMLFTDAAELRYASNDVPGALDQYRLATTMLGKGGPPLFDFTSRWFEVAARRLRADVKLREADQLLSIGRQMMPHDARVTLQSGLTAAFFAIANANAVDSLAREPLPPAGSLRERWRRDIDRARSIAREQGDRAEKWLGEAARGGSDVGSLQLARLLLMRGKPMNALATADPVLQRATDNDSAYIAALLGGAGREASGDVAGAAEHYTRAIAQNPDAQFGYVALSQVLMRQGRYEEARAALALVLNRKPSPDRLRDPWWLFGSDVGRPMDHPFDDLREEARR